MRLTWHADTGELSAAVNAGPEVLAGVGVALVDIHLTPGPGVSLQGGECEDHVVLVRDDIYLGTVAAVGPVGVDTDPVMFAGRGGPGTLVNVLLALLSSEAGGTGAGPLARHLVGVAPSPGVAGVDQALVVQVADQPGLTLRTLALVAAHLVVAGPAVQTGGDGAVVLVLLAVLPDEPVDTDALVAALGVLAGPVVLAGIVEGALVHVLQAVLTAPVVRTGTVVGVDAVHTDSAILTEIATAVINVDLTVLSAET